MNDFKKNNLRKLEWNKKDYNFFYDILQFKKSGKNSASFSGKLYFIYDSISGFIKSWKWSIEEALIDLFTTEAHFGTKQGNKRQKFLFSINKNFQMKKRIKKTQHDLMSLNQDEIENLNKYLNSQDITIKNVIYLIKGSNPSGEVLRPSSAELKSKLKFQNEIIDSNFAIFFNNFSLDKKNYFRTSWEEDFDENSKENYLDVLNEIDEEKKDKTSKRERVLKGKIIDLFFEPSNFEESILTKQEINKKFKNWQEKLQKRLTEATNYIGKINELVKKERTKYSAILQKDFDYYKVWNLSKYETQKCHIISYKYIKNWAIKYVLFNLQRKESNLDVINEKLQEKLNWISNPKNFLNFPNELHRIFDKDKFNYDSKSGFLIETTKEELISKLPNFKDLINKYFYIIEQKYLDEERKYFLKKRQEIIEKDKNLL